MKHYRIYGKAPFKVAVIHGGPGAPGEMEPVAKELSKICGVIEPFQTADSIDGQIQELYEILNERGALPTTLIGWSWGAWLSVIFASQYPLLVKKLILVSSGPFKEEYAHTMKTRLSRLSKEEIGKINKLIEILNSPTTENKDNVMAEFATLIGKADSYNPIITHNSKKISTCSYRIYKNVWKEASELRKSGKLLKIAQSIQCPVIAIHGDYDPHPYQGVEEPLSSALKKFRFILLENCGHYPWLEKEARKKFYSIIKDEIS